MKTIELQLHTRLQLYTRLQHQSDLRRRGDPAYPVSHLDSAQRCSETTVQKGGDLTRQTKVPTRFRAGAVVFVPQR
jgi:hypothetical protein